MDRSDALEVSRMTDSQLWDLLWSQLIQMSNYGFVDLSASEVRSSARVAEKIVKELRARSEQGKLFPA